MSFYLGPHKVGIGEPPVVIAEIGINHNGSMLRARSMVHAAALAGAHAVKFQCHVLEDEYHTSAHAIVPSNADRSIVDVISQAALTEEQDAFLKEYAEDLGLVYLSTPFSLLAVERLERLGVGAYKVGSGEVSNIPLLQAIAHTEQPVILSTGMHDVGHVWTAVEILRRGGCSVALLHCVSAYPTPYAAVNLPRMELLAEEFGLPVGLSDHSLGIYTALGAVALGACVIEKHFTLDRELPGPDHAISIESGELRHLVTGARAIWEAMNLNERGLEEPTKEFALASLVTRVAIAKGQRIEAHMLMGQRPNTGELAADHAPLVVGRVATQDLAAGHQMRRRDYA